MPADKADAFQPVGIAYNDSVNGVANINPADLRKRLDEVERIARAALGKTQAQVGSAAQPPVQSHNATPQIETTGAVKAK